MFQKLKAGILATGALLGALAAGNAQAVSALPTVKTFTQPDGTTFTGSLQGDEWFHWYKTTDGKVFLRNPATGAFEYAELAVVNGERQLRPTGVPVSPFSAFQVQVPEHNLWELARNAQVRMGLQFPPFRPLSELKSGGGLFSAQAMMTSTVKEFPTLVVMVEFNDIQLTNSLQPWAAKIFGSQPGSLNDYYGEVSNGQVRFVPAGESHGSANDGFVRIQLDMNHPHPGRDWGTAAQISAQALALADPYVDFASFDADGDGEASYEELQLVFIFAGPESASDGPEVGVWGHASALPYETSADGVKVGNGKGNYTAFGELQNGQDATVGIIAHELGHTAFRLPDLYPQVGGWDLMGTGSWGNRANQRGGESPVQMGAWSKWRAGFLEPSYVDPMYAAATFSLRRPLSGSQNTLLVPTQDGHIGFLLEHRRLEGYDLGLERWLGTGNTGKSGLLASVSYPSLSVVRADNADSGNTALTNLYYPGNVDRLGPNTAPNTSNPASGVASNYVFENIAYSGDEMTVAIRRAPGAAACQSYTASNSAHVSAGRAYTVTTGTWWKTTTYYAVGSEESLGTYGTTQTTLKESPAGYFAKGSCPPPAAPVVESLDHEAEPKRLVGYVSDAEDDIARVEIEFDGDGNWLRTSPRTTDVAGQRQFLFTYSGLSAGEHNVRVRATDAGARVTTSSPYSFTVLAPRAPSCSIDRVHRDTDGYWIAAGQANDEDNNLGQVEVRLPGGSWRGAALDWSNGFQGRLSDAPHGSPGALPDGSYTVEARVVDQTGLSGNCGPFAFQVGVEHLPSVERLDAVVVADALELNGDAADVDADITGVELELDSSGEWVLAESFYLDQNPTQGYFSHRFAGLAEGSHSVRARAVDAGGRRSAATAPVTLEVLPQVAPTCTIDDITVTEQGYTVAHGTATDVNNDLRGLEVQFLENGQWNGVWTPENWSQFVAEQPLPPGTYEIHARARDSRDALGYCSRTYVVAGAACVTSTNTEHVSAGRAAQCGSPYLPQACATGSGDNLGYASTYYNQTSSVQEDSPGYWVKVASCP